MAANVAVDPDEPCAVCGTKRDEHGDKHHQFSRDGQLIPIKPGDPPKNTPPAARGSGESKPNNPLKNDPTAHAFVRLVEVLSGKGLLSVAEHGYIFGGFYASDPGQPQEGTSEGSTPSSPQ